MRTFHKISKAGCEPTRLDLPDTMWADRLLKNISKMGYHVELTSEAAQPDMRDAAELARMRAILDAADPWPNGMTLADAQALQAAQSDSGS